MNSDLKVIENELVPVYETEQGVKVVDGRELHQALLSGQDFSTWVKKRLAECDAEENKDFHTAPQIYGTANGGHSTRNEYTIKLETAKEMAMLERNEKGKQVRKYFIEVEKKHKQSALDLEQLNPQTKLMNLLVQSISQNELEQKRIAKEQERQNERISLIEQNQTAISETFGKVSSIEEYQSWVNACITKIAESPKFDKGFDRKTKYSLARAESYERLSKKRNCRLDDRVQRAIGRAIEERPDIKKSELQKINKLYVIANDKDLRPAYELVIKEMMMQYCVN